MKAQLSTVRNSSTDLVKGFTPEIFDSIESEYRKNKESIGEVPVRPDSLIERIERGNILGAVDWSSLAGSAAVCGSGALLWGISVEEHVPLAEGILGFVIGGAIGGILFMFSEVGALTTHTGKSWSGLLETRVLRKRRSQQIQARAELEHSIALQEYNRNKTAVEKKLQEIEENSTAIVEAYNKANDRKIKFAHGVFSFDTKKLTRLEEIAYVAQQKAIEPSNSLALGE